MHLWQIYLANSKKYFKKLCYRLQTGIQQSEHNVRDAWHGNGHDVRRFGRRQFTSIRPVSY